MSSELVQVVTPLNVVLIVYLKTYGVVLASNPVTVATGEFGGPGITVEGPETNDQFPKLPIGGKLPVRKEVY
jgi:hypothetical protein